MAAYLVKYLYSPVAFEFPTSSCTGGRRGSAASLITGMASHLQQVAGPQYGVIGVCWFDTDTDTDWRVDQTTAAWQAWLAIAATRTSAATVPSDRCSR